MEGKGYAARLHLADALLLVIGSVIGGGIYFAPPEIAARCGSTALTLAMWVAGGLVSLAGAFCFAELGARFPQAGGSYVYLREGFGRTPAFLQGWSILMVSGAGSIAALALVCASHVFKVAGIEGDPRGIAVLAIAALTYVNCRGVRPGATVQDVLTVLKVLVLLAVVGGGLASAHAALPGCAMPPAKPPPDGGVLSLLGALGQVLFVYGGWQITNCLAAEIEDAPRRLPRALVIGLAIITAVYLAVNLAYINALSLPGLAATQTPAIDVMRQAAGGSGLKLLEAGVVISTLGFLSAVILTLPRMYQAMAADGALSGALAELHPAWRTPVHAILLQALWAAFLCVTGSLSQLVDYVVFGDWLFMALTGCSLLIVRRRCDPPPAYVAPGGTWLPAVFILTSLAVVVGTVARSPVNTLKGAAIILTGLPVLYLTARDSPPAR